MNASQKVTAAAMALIITLTGAIAVTAPATLPGLATARFDCATTGGNSVYPAGAGAQASLHVCIEK